MRVVFWGRLAKEQIAERLNRIDGVEVVVADKLPEVLAALPGAEALITADVLGEEAQRLAAALKAPGNTVRWIQFVSAGQEGLTAAGLPEHIQVSHQGGAVAPAVAEHAMALLLALARRIREIAVNTETALWDPSIGTRTTALEGRTLAIVGFGSIGRQIAKRARAFDMKIIGLSRRGTPDPLTDEMHRLADVREVLAAADAIVVCLALTAETYHLIGSKEFAACRRNAFFVNVGRGGLVDPDALREALAAGRIAGAGIDVTEPEPLPHDDPLWRLPNVIISPHIGGGGSPRSRIRLIETVGGNLERFVKGEVPRNLVAR